jgi:DNA-binding transcriptional MerR regulator
MYKELALDKIETRLKKLDPNNAYEFFNLMNDMEKSLHEGQAVSPATKENISKYLKKTIGLSLEEIETASQSEQTDDEIEKLNSRIDELEKENVELREQLQEMSDTDEENDEEEGDDKLEDDYEEEDDYTDDEEEDNEAPRIFKKKIKEDKVIEALRNLYSDKVIGKRRWYVIYRVLLFIEWLRLTNQIDFINWVKSHFGWNGVKEFRGVQSQFTHSDPPKWNYLIVKGKNGKPDNEELGPDYYDFAVTIRDALVDVDLTTGEMQDKDEFRANPHQGVLHNSKWK